MTILDVQTLMTLCSDLPGGLTGTWNYDAIVTDSVDAIRTVPTTHCLKIISKLDQIQQIFHVQLTDFPMFPILIAFPEDTSKLSDACDQQIRQKFLSRLVLSF
jgi:hypothetical protein